jgi:hypothetical protein
MDAFWKVGVFPRQTSGVSSLVLHMSPVCWRRLLSETVRPSRGSAWPQWEHRQRFDWFRSNRGEEGGAGMSATLRLKSWMGPTAFLPMLRM